MAVMLATAGVVGAHGGDASKIHACVDGQGSFRIAGDPAVPDPNATCPEGSRALDWNIQGPQGPAGAQGPAGSQGPAGPQGPPGASAVGSSSDRVDVYKAFSPKDKDNTKTVRARCPRGTRLQSGGYELRGATERLDVIASRPDPASKTAPTTWVVRTKRDAGSGDDDASFAVIAFAVCEGVRLLE